MVYRRSSQKRVMWLAIMVILSAGTLMVACSAPDNPAPPTPQVDCPEVITNKPERYEDLWARSAHADSKSEAFIHWDTDDPQEVPIDCAKCHSRPGFIDFLGVDGTTEMKVDNPAKIGTTITCFVCHNEVIDDITSVTFPSGIKIRELGPETRCLQCHQGRASTPTIDQAISELDLTKDDTKSDELAFINSHAISGATPFGSEVKGAYEYPGKSYRGRYVRGEEFFSCIQCHDSHTLELKSETCHECHTFTSANEWDIRVDTTDFDGDGDIQEGIAYEIEAFQGILLEEIQTYAIEVIGKRIAYEPNSHPYFFIDLDEDGVINSEEAIRDNRYTPWTPRLFRAAYNYNYVMHDPGAFAHNSDYTLQVLFDSIIDLAGNYPSLTRP